MIARIYLFFYSFLAKILIIVRIFMKIKINHAEQLGQVIRATRKAQGLRQDDTASMALVSENFLGKVEAGAHAVQWGKVFQVLKELGIYIEVDIDSDWDVELPTTLEVTSHEN